MTQTRSDTLTAGIKGAAMRCASLNAARLANLATASAHDQAWRVLLAVCGGDHRRAYAEYLSAAIKPKRRKK